MGFRRLFLWATIASAIGVPYLVQSDGANLWGKMEWLVGAVKSGSTSTSDISQQILPLTADTSAGFAPQTAATATSSTTLPHQSALTTNVSLRDALNFNITPSWVSHRWPEVSTTTAELELRGLRVALVTGTAADDVLGSLTFYFDNEQRLQRLALDGQTGDPHKLISLVTEYHGFRRERTLDAGLYTKRWNGRPTGILWIGQPRMVNADAVNTRFNVMLEINRTDGKYQLSDLSSNFMNARGRPDRW